MSRPPPPPPPQSELRQVETAVWKACAGTSVQIPAVHSRVYYFPQGHLEQSSLPFPNNHHHHLSSLVLSKPLIPCRVVAVQLLANSVTDEVFAKIRLQPLNSVPEGSRTTDGGDIEDGRGGRGEEEEEEEKVVVSFAKILTPSDANNGGGFSVPRFCADSIFPPLDFQADPPVQTLSITDIHGGVWAFRHIYRGTPRRHLLTTGWSKFVNKKKLVAGDSVVFMKNDRSGELYVGIRRAARASGDGGGRWSSQFGQTGGGGGDESNGFRMKVEEEGGGVKDGFWRTGKGRVSAESVMEGIELAVHGMAFEIVYYPRLGLPDFVVKAETVEAALNVFWTPGMRVKIAMETEDSSRMTYFQGTVSSAAPSDNGPWRGSPWRTLQVMWDDPEVLQHVKRVSPWQVEYGAPTPPPETDFPPMKKFRVNPNPGFLTDGGGQLLPMTGLTDSMTVQFKPSMLTNIFPAGMQGARHNPFYISSLSDFINEDTHGMCFDNSDGNKVVPGFNTMTTGLNTGSSQSDYSSPESQCTVHSSGIELIDNQGSNLSSKVGNSSFQLFGKIIHFKDPVESGFNEVGCTEDNVNKAYKDNEGVNDSLDLSLTNPYMNLLEKLDVECQRSSSDEARPLLTS